MQLRKILIRRIFSSDKFLVVALAAVFFSGIHGMGWGVYSCLNPDQMALRRIKSSPPLHPGSFDKPPFLTYVNNVLVNEPSKVAARVAVFAGADEHNAESARQRWRVLAGRLLQTFFYGGIVVFAYLYARDWFGLASARVTALLLGTCSGFVPFKIFLTADISLAFWMTGCIYFCGGILRNPDSVRASLLAGACAGLAVATKYNGLCVSVALPLAHFLAPGGFAAALRRRSFYLCGLAVPFFFIAGNPYCILDASKFANDFMFNYAVTPVYSGETGSGYGKFLARLPEIFGRPLSWLLVPIGATGFWSLRGADSPNDRRAMIIIAAVFAVYFWKIGSFPRMETRFVFPVAPVLLLTVAPGWQVLARRPALLTSVVALLCLYGLVSGWFVGCVFSQDPRMAAIDWARANMPSVAYIETAGSCPRWKFLENRKIKVLEFPEGMTRDRIFREKLGNVQWVNARLNDDEGKKDSGFFSVGQLHRRNPDFITIDSFYAGEKDAAPFLRQLLGGEIGYHIVFERSSYSSPSWVYPRSPDFTGGSFYVLAKD